MAIKYIPVKGADGEGMRDQSSDRSLVRPGDGTLMVFYLLYFTFRKNRSLFLLFVFFNRDKAGQDRTESATTREK